MDTVVVKLGRYQHAQGESYDYLRWADLGVNDANLATHTLMKEVMIDSHRHRLLAEHEGATGHGLLPRRCQCHGAHGRCGAR